MSNLAGVDTGKLMLLVVDGVLALERMEDFLSDSSWRTVSIMSDSESSGGPRAARTKVIPSSSWECSFLIS